MGGSAVTTREVLRIPYNDGWQLKRPSKAGKVTVPYHRGDIGPGTLNSIPKQAGLK
jgi:predicted RNA binding protein YcfA (HicA-like mRNA interferase family)